MTSLSYYGDLSYDGAEKEGIASSVPDDRVGVERADYRCQELAKAAGMSTSGTYLAWVSGSQSDPMWAVPAKARLNTNFNGEYVTIDGEVIAKGWSDLTDGILDTAITFDDFETPESSKFVWTNTDTEGESASNADCSHWSKTVNGGGVGDRTRLDGNWTLLKDVKNNPRRCDFKAHLYCFEDLP